MICGEIKNNALKSNFLAAFAEVGSVVSKKWRFFSEMNTKRIRCKSQVATQETPNGYQENKFLMVNVVKHWNRLLRDFAESISLEACRPRLAKALSTVVVVIL